jgi:hypothetical protein
VAGDRANSVASESHSVRECHYRFYPTVWIC